MMLQLATKMPRRSRQSAGPALMITDDDVEWARANAGDITAAGEASTEVADAGGEVDAVIDEADTEAVLEAGASTFEAEQEEEEEEEQPVPTPVVVAELPPPAPSAEQLRIQQLERQQLKMQKELETARQRLLLDQERARMELELEKERLKVQRLSLELDLEKQRNGAPSPPVAKPAPSSAPASSTGIVRQNRGVPPPAVALPAGVSKKAATVAARQPTTPVQLPAAQAANVQPVQPVARVKSAPAPNRVLPRAAGGASASPAYRGAQPRENVSSDALLHTLDTPLRRPGPELMQSDRSMPQGSTIGIGMGSRSMPYNPAMQQRAVGGLF